jgi:hypothetical protein
VFARVDTGRCEVCTAIPLQLQWVDIRYYPPASSCSGCSAALTLLRSRIRGYCEECAITAVMPDPTHVGVDDAWALAALRQLFPDIRIVDDEAVADDQSAPADSHRITPASFEANDAYRKGLCIDCRSKPHSAGRPRCYSCHCPAAACGGTQAPRPHPVSF